MSLRSFWSDDSGCSKLLLLSEGVLQAAQAQRPESRSSLSLARLVIMLYAALVSPSQRFVGPEREQSKCAHCSISQLAQRPQSDLYSLPTVEYSPITHLRAYNPLAVLPPSFSSPVRASSRERKASGQPLVIEGTHSWLRRRGFVHWRRGFQASNNYCPLSDWLTDWLTHMPHRLLQQTPNTAPSPSVPPMERGLYYKQRKEGALEEHLATATADSWICAE